MYSCDVYVRKVERCMYPEPPYNPSEIYPELSNLPYSIELNPQNNEVYSSIREILFELGYDRKNYGTELWNPFKGVIRKGQKVLIKPNLVRGQHPMGDDYVKSMITNSSLIRPLIDYILLATDAEVNITIGDVPLQDANWNDVIKKSGLKSLCEFYNHQGIHLDLIDMRKQIAIVNSFDIITKRIDNESRTQDMFIPVDLGKKSELIDVIDKANNFEITDYEKGTVKKHHNENKNEYLLPKEVLEADFFINVPKLKTHRKAGITCAMKNLIGINGDKSWIAHHTKGLKGDEFSKLNLKTIFKVRIWFFLKRYSWGIKLANLIKWFYQKYIWKGKTYKQISMSSHDKVSFEGSWHGNDTIWRCIKDLNKIIFYADKKGKMHSSKQRKYLCITDALLAGEGEGPMEQTTKKFGVLFGSTNPVYNDFTASILAKYNYKNLPTVFHGFENRWWNLVEKKAKEVNIKSNKSLIEISDYFLPTNGWKEKLYELNLEEKNYNWEEKESK